ncbi:MAG TPA: MOSC N-terminal beta barrel domain-containing protein [Ignavibacteriaceae bacterium]|nr:MOSC N-terminal beta barrel domain-containing protein [Ignavibacteriaceae bacterium]
MNSLTLSEINIFPVKSLGGISLQSSVVEERGLQYDRRWLLVDDKGVFITQRDFPQMALMELSLSENNLSVKYKSDSSLPAISIPLKFFSDERIDVIIWDDKCKAVPVNKEYDDWFSETLKMKCRLVKMPDDERRIVEKKFISEDKIVSFADAYPFLIIGQSSLNDLNSKMIVKLPMNRFRTNFVISGGKPFEEDKWKNFNIGDVKFKAVKPCARCVITTTDQETAVRSEEPLRTLATYRNFKNKVLFGMNLIAFSNGTVKVGDSITLID